MHNSDNLIDIQKDHLIRYFIDRANRENLKIDVDLLSRSLEEDKVSDSLGYPFISKPTDLGAHPDRKLDSHVNIDIPALNDTVMGFKTDIVSVRDTIKALSKHVDLLNRSIERSQPLLHDARLRVENSYKELRRQMGLVAYTYREALDDISRFDIANTTAYVDINRRLIQASKASTLDSNIAIGVLNADTLKAYSENVLDLLATDAQFYKLFIKGAENKTTLTIRKNKREATNAVITAKLADLNIYGNTLIINTLHTVPTKTTITIESGSESILIAKDEYLIDSIYTFTFEPIKIDRVNIVMEQTIESARDNDYFLYRFRMNNIALELLNFSNDAHFVTQPITTNFPITDVMIETTDFRPHGTDIKYYVSRDKDRWIPIVPRNLKPDAANNTVTLSLTSVDEFSIGNHTRSWSSLTPIDSYGANSLINLLEYSTDQHILSTPGEVDSTRLSIVEDPDDEIIEDTIQVFRGYDDWAIEERTLEIERAYQNIEYRFQPYQMASGEGGEILSPLAVDYQYDDISMQPFLRIDDEAHVIDLSQTGDKQIITKYPISNNSVRVIDIKLNRIIKLNTIEPIDYDNGIIKLDNTATVGNDVLVTYHAYIENIQAKDNVKIDIVPSSLTYKRTETIRTDLPLVNEVYYSPYDRLVHLARNNTIPTNKEGWITAYLSFKTLTRSNDKYRVFKTYIYYNQDTEIEILPFTQEEITMGNMHIIDGNNVSSRKTYTMTGGWHEIITTQPYKNDPNNPFDVNKLTNKTCNAGIKLGNYIERRGFQKSLRKVSTNTLANIMPPGDQKTFAYSNGRIYVNFIPDELPENAIIVSTELTGTSLLCKEAIYLEDGKNTFDSYVAKHETFVISYKTRPKDPTGELKTMYVKGELITNKSRGTSPSLFKFEVLFL